MSIQAENLDPELTISSGQMFLWEKRRDAWYGIHTDHVLRISFNNGGHSDKNNECVTYDSFPYTSGWETRLFRMDDDITRVLRSISRDPIVRSSISRYQGLRVMRQDPIQCVFSFLCASNTNIQRIRRTLYNLCKKFGKKMTVDGEEFFTFPSARDLRRADISEIISCGTGYRAKFIKRLAERIDEAEFVPQELVQMSYDDAKFALLDIYGIGDKTADCILLFSLEKLDAFPIDIWIARIISSEYNMLYKDRKLETWENMPKVSHQQYRILSNCMRNYFGKYAGYAQQYLYYNARHVAGRNW